MKKGVGGGGGRRGCEEEWEIPRLLGSPDRNRGASLAFRGELHLGELVRAARESFGGRGRGWDARRPELRSARGDSGGVGEDHTRCVRQDLAICLKSGNVHPVTLDLSRAVPTIALVQTICSICLQPNPCWGALLPPPNPHSTCMGGSQWGPSSFHVSGFCLK